MASLTPLMLLLLLAVATASLSSEPALRRSASEWHGWSWSLFSGDPLVGGHRRRFGGRGSWAKGASPLALPRPGRQKREPAPVPAPYNPMEDEEDGKKKVKKKLSTWGKCILKVSL